MGNLPANRDTTPLVVTILLQVRNVLYKPFGFFNSLAHPGLTIYKYTDNRKPKDQTVRIARILARCRVLGWAKHTGFFSASRGPTLMHRTIGGGGEAFNQIFKGIEPSSIVYDIFESGRAVSAAHMTRHLLSEGNSVKAITGVWNKFTEWHKKFNFNDLVEWLIARGRYIMAARILEATASSLKPRTIGQAFAELVYGNLALLEIPPNPYWQAFRERQARRLKKLLMFLLEIKNNGVDFGTVQQSQFILYHILRNLPPEELPEFYSDVALRGLPVRAFTILHFIDRLGRTEDYYKGYLLLRAMQNDRKLKPSLLTRKAITLLLSQAAKLGQQEHAEEVIKTMFDAGLSADTTVYNVLMYNAIRNGQMSSALAIYREMLDEGLRPNPVTFAMLFNMYKRTGNVAEQRKVIIQVLETEKCIDDWLATDIVHAAFMSADRGYKYRTTLDTYQKLYEPGVLGLMGLVPKQCQNTNRLQPSPAVVAVVMIAYLEDETDANAAWALYQRYRKLRDTEEYNSMFELNPIIPNAFMYVFGRQLSALSHLLEVMEDLQAPSTLRWKKKPAPNQYSWSIMVKSFAKHGKLKEAEQILKTMGRRGLKPTEATWTALLQGYLNAGEFQNGGVALGKMIMSGLEPTDKTLRVLSAVGNKEKFQTGLQSVLQKSKKPTMAFLTLSREDHLEAEREEKERLLFAENLDRFQKSKAKSFSEFKM